MYNRAKVNTSDPSYSNGEWQPLSVTGAGATDSTNGATDIAGTARPSGSAYDIGCWELVQGGGGGSTQQFVMLLGIGS